MFIKLVISACLLTSDECRDHVILFDPRDVTVMACMMSAQPIIAQWQDRNPHWRVVRWTCGIHDPTTADL